MNTETKTKVKNRKILPANNAPHLPPGGVSVFIAVATVLQLIFFFLHFMIYETLGAAFRIETPWLGILLFALSLTFITATILVTKSKHALAQAYYKLGAIWFSFVAPLCGACFGFVIVEDILPRAGIVVAPFAAGLVCFGTAVLITLYGMWNSTRAEITRIVVKSPVTRPWPAFWRGKKIVFFSDSHFGALWGRGSAEKIVRKINALQPEAVLIGGDLFDGPKCDADALLVPFQQLRPPLGIFYVTGNHEYIRGDGEDFLGAIRRSNIKILASEKIDLQGIELVGVDYKDTHKKEDLAAILEKLEIKKDRPEGDKPSILIKHVPDFLDAAEQAGVSLTLCGHTHRGQFWPLSLITRRIYKGFDYGLKPWGAMQVYTSSGVGTWMSPFRFGTKSEIVVIEFA